MAGKKREFKPEISKESLQSLLEIQCTRDEVMRFYGFKSKNPLQTWVKANYDGRTFEEVKQMYSTGGQISLRRRAYEVAEKQPALMIFLLKSVCHMSDEPTVTEDTDDHNVSAFLSSIRTASKAISNCDDLIAGLPKKEDDEIEGEEENEEGDISDEEV